MDAELQALLAKARSVSPTETDMKNHRVAMAAANGYISDERVTVAAVRATAEAIEAYKQTRG